MTIQERIDSAVARTYKAKQEYFELEYDEDDPQVLNPPATNAQLADVERRLGRPLPPSYRAFLSRHNGWLEFTGGAMVLPTDEYDKPWVVERLKDIRAHLRTFKDAPIDHGFMIILGEDERDYVYLDTTRPLEGGELEVVHSSIVEGEIRRFPDFAALLEYKAASWERLAADAK